MQRRRTLLRTGILLLGAGAVLPLMRLEGGLDTVYAGSVFLVLILTWIAGRQNARQTVQSTAALLAWPFWVSSILITPLLHRIAQADVHHHESGAVAFMARGWAPESGGEYCHTYEQIDFLTPAEDKKSTQVSILASQAVYNPRAILFQLLPVKCAKYFLLGYASGAEDMLEFNGARRAKLLAEGARTAFLLAALPWMAWGGVLLLPLLRRTQRLGLVLPCSFICATYVLLGETSPRYSIYIQPFLFMLGALPLAWSVRRRRRLFHWARAPGLVAASSLGIAFLLAAGTLYSARPWLQRHALQDMRWWKTLPESQSLALPATLTPFEIHLAPQVREDGTDWGAVQFPANPDRHGTLSFYAIPVDAPSGLLRGALLITEYSTGNGIQMQTNSLPGRIRLDYSPPTSGVIKLRSPLVLPFPLRIGYAQYELHEN
jgi:hypothetical protein